MRFLFSMFFILGVMAEAITQNLTIYLSEASVEVTVQKVEEIIKSKDLILFERVSHEIIAQEQGIELDPTEIVIFEDPKLTTDLILCEQTAALDLPLKIMVWEENEDTYIGYIDPKLMKRRFLIEGCDDTIQKIAGLMVRIVNEALREL